MSNESPRVAVAPYSVATRARRPADWCIKSIDQCWTQKEPRTRDTEKAAAKQAYDEAKAIYRKILAESEVE